MTHKTIAFRVDGCPKIGTGHYMRCLQIAKELSKNKVEVVFVTKEHDNHFAKLIVEQGYKTHLIPKSPEPKKYRYTYHHWVGGTNAQDALSCAQLGYKNWFVDHYGLDASWGKMLKKSIPGAKITILDDMQDRPLLADIIVDPNIRNKKNIEKWNELAPGIQIMQGPDFVPISPVFQETTPINKDYSKDVKHILINYSGVDYHNATQKTINALLQCRWHQSITILANPNTPYIPEWAAYKEKFLKLDITYGYTPKQMAKLYQKTDLAFGGGGVASWERAIMKVPTVMACLAENQKNQYQELIERKAILGIGSPTQTDFQNTLINQIQGAFQADKRAHISNNAKAICDGQGLMRLKKVLLKD